MQNELCPEHDGALSFWSVLEFLKSGWRWLAGGVLLGLFVAIAFVMIVPAQYEAIAVIQPATVGVATANSFSTKGAEVESTAQTLERLKTPTFYSDELLQACGVRTQSNAQRVLAKAMAPTLVKGNSLIQIGYRAESPAVARTCLVSVVNQLAKVQAALADPIINTLEDQLSFTKQQLYESERLQHQIEKRAMSLDPSDAKFSQSMLMLNAALSKREEISKLRKLYAEQSLQLSRPLTQPAQLFEPIDVSDKVVFPKKALTVLGGVFGGLVLGGLAFFVRRRWLGRLLNT